MPEKIMNPWGIDLYLLRSAVPGVLGGNKAAKLGGYIARARREGQHHLVTMAGAHSNHLRAFAALIKNEQLSGTALIRGDELTDVARHSHEIRFAISHGVRCQFIDRATYRQLRSARTGNELAGILGEDLSLHESLFIPEGGLGADGVSGVVAWAQNASDFDHVVLACATGTTAAGFLLASAQHCIVHGVAVLQNSAAVMEAIATFAAAHAARFHLIDKYAPHRFGPWRGTLSAEAAQFSERYFSRADVIYTPRVTAALEDLAHSGQLIGRILFVYTYNE